MKKYNKIIKQGKKAVKVKYDELTDWNAHGEAIRLLCEYFGRDLDIKKMEHINTLHTLYGELTPELAKMRDEIWSNISNLYYKEFTTFKVEDIEIIKEL